MMCDLRQRPAPDPFPQRGRRGASSPLIRLMQGQARTARNAAGARRLLPASVGDGRGGGASLRTSFQKETT